MDNDHGITGELREWAEDALMRLSAHEEVAAIADRIDAEHERQCAESWMRGHDAWAAIDRSDEMAELGWVRLPKDADGERIHIGDKVTCGASVWTVTGLKFLGEGWGVCCTVYNEYGGSGTSVYPPSDLRHHHKPTVEDVLKEFAFDVLPAACMADHEVTDAIERFAPMLQLRGDAE